jgi:hypothetical protein
MSGLVYVSATPDPLKTWDSEGDNASDATADPATEPAE